MLASVDRMVDALSDGADATSDLARWIDKLHDMVERHQGAPLSLSRVNAHSLCTDRTLTHSTTCIVATVSLEVVSTREKVAARVDHALESVLKALADTTFDAAGASNCA